MRIFTSNTVRVYCTFATHRPRIEKQPDETTKVVVSDGKGLGQLCQMGRVWASQPAKKGGRSVKGKKNSNADVMYICVSVCVM